MARYPRGALSFGVQYSGFQNLPAALLLLRKELAEVMDLERIALRAEKEVKQRFKLYGPRAKKDPSGARWKSLAPSTVRRKNRLGINPRHILVETGDLAASIKAVRTQFQIVNGLGTARWRIVIQGKAAEYGYLHDRGSGRIPQRQFLGIDEKGQKQIQKDVDATASRAVRKFQGAFARPSKFISGQTLLNRLS